MKKIIIAMIVFLLTLVVTLPIYATPNTVSYGTIGSGATATGSCSGVELYTPDGGAGSAYVRLEIDGGIALNAISTLSYIAKVTDLGPPFGIYDSFAPEVVLNIDADNDGILEGTGIGWMHSGWNPSALGYVDGTNRGDNFLSGDNWEPSLATPDTSFVTRNALGDYNYWEADDARSGFGTTWTPWSSLTFPVHDIDGTDLVYSIDFVVGTSGNFDGMRALFQSVELNGIIYPVPVVLPPSKSISGGGQILEEEGDKRKDWYKISFGGNATDEGCSSYVGEWQIVFHNVSNDSLDKAKFHGTNVTVMNFYPGDGCINGAMNFTIEGTLNGECGYKVTFRAGDEPDTVRVQLYQGSSKIYDSSDGDFNDESSCHGSNRTGLDNGNITIVQ